MVQPMNYFIVEGDSINVLYLPKKTAKTGPSAGFDMSAGHARAQSFPSVPDLSPHLRTVLSFLVEAPAAAKSGKNKRTV